MSSEHAVQPHPLANQVVAWIEDDLRALRRQRDALDEHSARLQQRMQTLPKTLASTPNPEELVASVSTHPFLAANFRPPRRASCRCLVPVLSAAEIGAALQATGISEASATAARSSSPLLTRLERGVYGLVGRPADLREIASARVRREAAKEQGGE